MAIFRLRGNNYWLWTVFWSGTALAIMTWQLCRRCGFSTDYARVRYLCTQGEYRCILECGAVSDNRWLPPHLRLDQRSYLDAEDAVICEPPAYDLSVTEKELVVALVDVLPDDKKADITATWFGLFNTRTMAFSLDDHERVLKRRIGVSTRPEDLLEGGGGDDSDVTDLAMTTKANAAEAPPAAMPAKKSDAKSGSGFKAKPVSGANFY